MPSSKAVDGNNCLFYYAFARDRFSFCGRYLDAAPMALGEPCNGVELSLPSISALYKCLLIRILQVCIRYQSGAVLPNMGLVILFSIL